MNEEPKPSFQECLTYIVLFILVVIVAIVWLSIAKSCGDDIHMGRNNF